MSEGTQAWGDGHLWPQSSLLGQPLSGITCLIYSEEKKNISCVTGKQAVLATLLPIDAIICQVSYV